MHGRAHRRDAPFALLDALDIRATTFWGHSMGGAVALTLGRRHPQRVLSLIVTGYSPCAAGSEESSEMAAWAGWVSATPPFLPRHDA